MILASNYQRFKQHLESGGTFYAFWRGIKYLLFLLKKQKNYHMQYPDCLLIKDRTKIICSYCGVNIFYNDRKLTSDTGLNVAINRSGKWTDSSRANWHILEKGNDYFKVNISLRYLPVNLIWIIKIENEQQINWQIDMQVRGSIDIDEFRILAHIDTCYKSWINNYQQGDFSRLDNRWHNICLDDSPSHLVGMRFPVKDEFIPPFTLEPQPGEQSCFPLIQKPPLITNSFIAGFRKMDFKGRKTFASGHYHLFSVKVSLLKNEHLLDKKIESIRQNYLKTARQEKEKFSRPQKNLKLLLANLPWQKNGRWGVRAGSRWPHIKIPEEKDYIPFPFFLAYSASLLKQNGFSVVFIDALAEEIPEQEFLIRIAKENPDLFVAETSTPSLENDLNILKKLPKNLSKVLCGPEQNICTPAFLTKNNFVDFVLIKEYEFTLLRLAESLRENRPLDSIPGLIYRQGSNIRINPNWFLIEELDTLPWPLREGLPMDKYNDCPGEIPRPSAQMVSSRGCPYKCNFCAWPNLIYGGNSYRVRSIRDVVDEMEYLTAEMGFKSIYFDDDTFNIGKNRMLEFAAEIKRRKAKGKLLNVPWAIMARFDIMDEEILENLREAGLSAIKYGIESATQELLDRTNKNLDLKKAKGIVEYTKKLGIKVHLTFMFGLPGETKQTIQRTINFALELDPDSVQFSIATPFPGTEYFNELKSKNCIFSEDGSEYDGNYRSPIWTEHLTGKDLIVLKKRAYAIWKKHKWRKKIEQIEGKEYPRRFIDSLKRYGLISALQKAAFSMLFKLTDICRKSINSIRKKGLRKTVITIKDELSPKKVVNKYLEIAGIFDQQYAFTGPSCVQIDLTDSCNNNCIGCWCNSDLLGEKKQKQKDALDFTVVKKLINELQKMGTRELYFSGGGEPLLHPDFFDIIDYAKQRKMVCYVNTNFTIVDDAVIKRLINLKIDYLTVSTWAATAKTYALTHPNKNKSTFYLIQDMLCLLNNSKKDSIPHVKLYNVIFNLNYQELEKMVDFALNTKSEAVEFTVIDTIPQATDRLLLSREQCQEVLEQCARLEQRCDQSGRIGTTQLLNLKHVTRRISDLRAEKAEYDSQFVGKIPCYAGWMFARIMPDGNVNSCLKSHRFPVGNIYQDSFRAIWNSLNQRTFRQKTIKFDTDDPFFSSIGNDPNATVGCYKSCDNISGNIQMHRTISGLTLLEKLLLKVIIKAQKLVHNNR